MAARFCVSIEPLSILGGCYGGRKRPKVLLCPVPVACDSRRPGRIGDWHSLERLSVSSIQINTLAWKSIGDHNFLDNAVAKSVALSFLVCRDKRRGGSGAYRIDKFPFRQ